MTDEVADKIRAEVERQLGATVTPEIRARIAADLTARLTYESVKSRLKGYGSHIEWVDFHDLMSDFHPNREPQVRSTLDKLVAEHVARKHPTADLWQPISLLEAIAEVANGTD